MSYSILKQKLDAMALRAGGIHWFRILPKFYINVTFSRYIKYADVVNAIVTTSRYNLTTCLTFRYTEQIHEAKYKKYCFSWFLKDKREKYK